MTTYVALLRAVNVGGRTVGMAPLRQLVAALGHTQVRTHLQSGNVLFDAPAAEPSRLAEELEARIAAELGVPTTIMLRSAGELARVVAAGHPFGDREPDLAKLHVGFLQHAPAEEPAAALAPPAGGPEALSVAGRELYVHYPDGAGRSKLTTTYVERQLGVAATFRNWRTVTKLHELAGA